MYDRMSAKKVFFICRYASDDVERIIEFNKNLLADNNKKYFLMMDKPLLGNWERIICALF